MNNKEIVIRLIQDYLATVKQGVECLNVKLKENPNFSQEFNSDGSLISNGRIESKHASYEFHGATGCIIKWDEGTFVDFNLGPDARCDGFDPWFVFSYYNRNEKIKNEYGQISGLDIKENILALILIGEIVEDETYDLFYFKEDFENPTPFKWS